jgi:hypothetical protein
MEKDQGTQHALFQDHGDILDEISHDSLILFAFYREYHKKNKKKPWLTNLKGSTFLLFCMW